MTRANAEGVGAAVLAFTATSAGLEIALPDPVRAAVLGLVSALVAWTTSWLLNRLKKALGG